jgi:hypothetical protein
VKSNSIDFSKHKVNAAYLNGCCDKRDGMVPKTKSTVFNDEDWFEYRCCLQAAETASSLHLSTEQSVLLRA